VIPAGEAGHSADITDDGRGEDRANPEQPGQAGPDRPDRYRQLLPGLAERRVDAPQLLGERPGQLAAGRRNRVRGRDRFQDPRSLGSGDLPANAAGYLPVAAGWMLLAWRAWKALRMCWLRVASRQASQRWSGVRPMRRHQPRAMLLPAVSLMVAKVRSAAVRRL
jgi:hypothetical protein